MHIQIENFIKLFTYFSTIKSTDLNPNNIVRIIFIYSSLFKLHSNMGIYHVYNDDRLYNRLYNNYLTSWDIGFDWHN